MAKAAAEEQAAKSKADAHFAQLPWLTSESLGEAIAAHSGIEHDVLVDTIGALQQQAKKRGFSSVFTLTTGNVLTTDKAGTKPTRLTALRATPDGGDTWKFEIYDWQLGEGRPRYLEELRQKGIAPNETVKLTGHDFVHTVNGVEYSGQF